MRFKSQTTNGYQVFAVTGPNTVSFGIDATAADTTGLLGFAVEREDPTENEQYYLPGYKVFPSVIPQPAPGALVSTFEHPVQSFVWDDFTAKPGRAYRYIFHPLKGKPRNLDRSGQPIGLRVTTEPLFDDIAKHQVFFNRGVASSQAYAWRFHNKRPDQLPPGKQEEALEWLGRDLDEAILKFISTAQPGDTLLGAFYEFRYWPVAEALKEAVDRGVKVRLVVDAKINEYTDSKGVFHTSFPRKENLELIKDVGLPEESVTLREARPGAIAHNKFMVLLEGAQERPTQVWTGSTNISLGGIFGQTNVGHWLRDKEVAARFADYWGLLHRDPGAKAGDDETTTRQKNKAFRESVESIVSVPLDWRQITTGVTPAFSPRKGTEVLRMYAKMTDEAADLSCITLAFGINKQFKDQFIDHTPESHLAFFLLEKRDVQNPQSNQPFVALNAKQNVYMAWGSYLKDPLSRWARETNTRNLEFNEHVLYIHSKFLLKDPLSTDPIVVTGSANFSDSSQKENDENMLIIRGDQRVADIYFTEFNRLFNHYYFRSITEALQSHAGSTGEEHSLLLAENDSWLAKYGPGKLRSKRVEIFRKMQGVAST